MPPMERSQNESQVNGDVENGESRVVDDSPQHIDRESVCTFVTGLLCLLFWFVLEFLIRFIGWYR